MSDPIVTTRGIEGDTRRQIEATWGPALVTGGDEALVYHGDLVIPLGREEWVKKIRTFLGVDTGDIVETHAEVYDEADRRLYTRSMHKEGPGIYDAWDMAGVSAPARNLRVSIVCRVTGRNWWVFTRRLNPLTAYFHAAVVVELESGATNV